MTRAFPGGQLVRRLEAETTAAPKRKAQRVLPDKSKASDVYTKFFEDMHGHRGHNSKFYFLSPWEFMMLWDVCGFRSRKGEATTARTVRAPAKQRKKAARRMCHPLFRPILLRIPQS